jgi:dephospho-CoA kinase
MLQVGLTGGIGSGKSLVCSILEKFRVPVYYADVEARRLMNLDPGLKDQIRALVGEKAYRNEELDRKYVSDRLFGNQEMLEAMNALVHPAVRKDFTAWTQAYKEAPYVVKEAAILFESGAHRGLDRTVLVVAPKELRIRRVMERDRCDRETVLKRMGHQMAEGALKKLANHVIVNDGQQMLLPQVVELHDSMLTMN